MRVPALTTTVNHAEVNGWKLGIKDSLQDRVRKLLRLTGIEPRSRS